ncbi:MAG: hypothetical protein KKF44_08600 [Nanoarchaeota archaeon]|nr:hypothetical protein [Nanoarchaeota archaeon]
MSKTDLRLVDMERVNGPTLGVLAIFRDEEQPDGVPKRRQGEYYLGNFSRTKIKELILNVKGVEEHVGYEYGIQAMHSLKLGPDVCKGHTVTGIPKEPDKYKFYPIQEGHPARFLAEKALEKNNPTLEELVMLREALEPQATHFERTWYRNNEWTDYSIAQARFMEDAVAQLPFGQIKDGYEDRFSATEQEVKTIEYILDRLTYGEPLEVESDEYEWSKADAEAMLMRRIRRMSGDRSVEQASTDAKAAFMANRRASFDALGHIKAYLPLPDDTEKSFEELYDDVKNFNYIKNLYHVKKGAQSEEFNQFLLRYYKAAIALKEIEEFKDIEINSITAIGIAAHALDDFNPEFDLKDYLFYDRHRGLSHDNLEEKLIEPIRNLIAEQDNTVKSFHRRLHVIEQSKDSKDLQVRLRTSFAAMGQFPSGSKPLPERKVKDLYIYDRNSTLTLDERFFYDADRISGIRYNNATTHRNYRLHPNQNDILKTYGSQILPNEKKKHAVFVCYGGGSLTQEAGIIGQLLKNNSDVERVTIYSVDKYMSMSTWSNNETDKNSLKQAVQNESGNQHLNVDDPVLIKDDFLTCDVIKELQSGIFGAGNRALKALAEKVNAGDTKLNPLNKTDFNFLLPSNLAGNLPPKDHKKFAEKVRTAAQYYDGRVIIGFPLNGDTTDYETPTVMMALYRPFEILGIPFNYLDYKHQFRYNVHEFVWQFNRDYTLRIPNEDGFTKVFFQKGSKIQTKPDSGRFALHDENSGFYSTKDFCKVISGEDNLNQWNIFTDNLREMRPYKFNEVTEIPKNPQYGVLTYKFMNKNTRNI